MKNQEILIVSSSKKKGEDLFKITSEVFSPETILVKTYDESKKDLDLDSSFKLVIVGDSLDNHFGKTLIKKALKNKATQILFIIPKKDYLTEYKEFEDLGVIILESPTKSLFSFSLKLIKATIIRLENIQKINSKLTEKLDNLRIVDRAKCILISHLNMNEEEAHKYIEKKAMNSRSSKRYIAETILKTYEN